MKTEFIFSIKSGFNFPIRPLSLVNASKTLMMMVAAISRFANCKYSFEDFVFRMTIQYPMMASSVNWEIKSTIKRI